MYHIIINPASCTDNGIILWEKIVAPALQKENVSYRTYLSEKAGEIATIAKDIYITEKERPLHYIVLGGDGSVNEFLQGIPDTKDVILGYIPTGSSNDLARDLGFSKNPTENLKRILYTGTPRWMDLGTAVLADGTIRRFANSCGIGFDAAVCEQTNRSKVKRFMNRIGLGKLSYLGIALMQLFAAKKVSATLTLKGKEPIEIKNMLFTAGMIHRYSGGGFMFAPNANDSDGLLELCEVGDIPKLLVLCALPTAFWGKHFIFSGVNAHTTDSYTIHTTAPMWVQTDGEVIGKTNQITISCEKHAIRIIV